MSIFLTSIPPTEWFDHKRIILKWLYNVLLLQLMCCSKRRNFDSRSLDDEAAANLGHRDYYYISQFIASIIHQINPEKCPCIFMPTSKILAQNLRPKSWK